MKSFLITFGTLMTFAFLLMNFTTKDKATPTASASGDFEIPADIQAIIDNSCYGCHNADSDDEKGKKKLQFDQLAHLKTYKLVGKLADISDVVNEGDMPPKKAVKKYPEIKLSDEDKTKLADWAKQTAESLSN